MDTTQIAKMIIAAVRREMQKLRAASYGIDSVEGSNRQQSVWNSEEKEGEAEQLPLLPDRG